mgnify:CR=1 FL=1
MGAGLCSCYAGVMPAFVRNYYAFAHLSLTYSKLNTSVYETSGLTDGRVKNTDLPSRDEG